MVYRKIHNFDATMEASMLIRTTKASMAVSNTLISSHRRAGGTTITTRAMDTTITLSRTSTEGTLQTGLMRSRRLQRITRRTSAITMTRCQLVPKIRSSVTVTINRTKSLLSQRSKRQTLTTSLLKLGQLHKRKRKKEATTSKTKCCW